MLKFCNIKSCGKVNHGKARPNDAVGQARIDTEGRVRKGLKPKEKPYFHQILLDYIGKLVGCLERLNKGEIDAGTSFKAESVMVIFK